jgi:phosphoglycolate phosphatase-like HAD superfamily hydrolase
MPFDPGRVRGILFDLDGTLVDTDDDYIRRAGELMRRLAFLFPQRDPTRFLRWSLMVSESPLNLLMGMPDWLGVDAPLARLADWFTRGRGAGPPPVFTLMAGMDLALPRLAERYPMGIVTARSDDRARAFLSQFGLAPYFGAVAGALTAPHTKPYPDPVIWAAHALDVPVEHCLMVGDTTVDILAGKRAGAQTVGVLCGFGDRGELERTGANLILEHTTDLEAALPGLPAQRSMGSG